MKELAFKLNQTVEQVRDIAGHSGSRVVSLEKMMTERGGEGSAPWEATDRDKFRDPAAAADRRAALGLLDAALGSLSKRDKHIIQLRYGRSLPFHEIGALLNLSESRVCQLHKRILSSLKSHLKRDADLAA